MSFGAQIIAWDASQPPRYPWVTERDPYRILVSEYLLQQTRGAQALPYYERIIQQYPTIHHLAAAPIDEVLQLWQGLGYYRRAHHLHRATQAVVAQYDGHLPSDETLLRSLPGIGPYTAAAIASFAYGQPCAVVDGNVYRVLSRYHADDTPRDTSKSHAHYAALAHDHLMDLPSGAFNQAIMNLGAYICTPRRAKCETCPVSGTCRAYAQGDVTKYPVRTKRRTYKDRYLHFIHYDLGVDLYLLKRVEKDIWQGLYALPSLQYDVDTSIPVDELMSMIDQRGWPVITQVAEVSDVIPQTLTHLRLKSRFYRVKTDASWAPSSDWIQAGPQTFHRYPMPKTVLKYTQGL